MNIYIPLEFIWVIVSFLGLFILLFVILSIITWVVYVNDGIKDIEQLKDKIEKLEKNINYQIKKGGSKK